MKPAVVLASPSTPTIEECVRHAELLASDLAGRLLKHGADFLGAGLRASRAPGRLLVTKVQRRSLNSDAFSGILPKRRLGVLQEFLLAAHRAARPILATVTNHSPSNHRSDPRSDEALVVAHRAGDANALRIIIERYQGELHGFLTRLVGSRTGADDVFQEAFLQVHLSADSFDEERRFKPWLYTIAANKGRDFLRRQKRRAAVSLDAPVRSSGGSVGDASLIDLIGDGSDSPSSSLESRDEASIVKVVVDELPAHFREILLLAYFQKMSYAQISDSLSIPLGTVKSRLHASVACFAESWKIACARSTSRTDAIAIPSGTRNKDSRRSDA